MRVSVAEQSFSVKSINMEWGGGHWNFFPSSFLKLFSCEPHNKHLAWLIYLENFGMVDQLLEYFWVSPLAGIVVYRGQGGGIGENGRQSSQFIIYLPTLII